MNPDGVKAKLKNIADSTNRPFMKLFKALTFERFLARVASSSYRENLIFKGGLCLKNYIETNRETKDIDFLVKKIGGELAEIDLAFKAVSSIDLEDAFIFSDVVVSLLTLEHKQYPGYRIKIDVHLGKMKDRLQVDVGIGDIVDEAELELNLLAYKEGPLLDQGSVSVLAYPAEFIFSEKLQAIIELKTLNSRMKDYFDCYMLISSGVLDKNKLSDAIKRTFKQRETDIQLIADYSSQLQNQWDKFIKKVPLSPEKMSSVIEMINSYLKEVLPE